MITAPSINWDLISLEVLITLVLSVLVVADIVLHKEARHKWLGNISFVGIFGLIVFWFAQGHLRGITFGGMFVVDSLSWFFKGFFLVTMAFVFAMTQQYFKSLGSQRNEYYLLMWLSLLGMCLIASAADFLVLFIAIEIMTISLYVMTAYLKNDKHSLEAGMKYLILGALSSGFFLYGISYLYGITHSTNFAMIQSYVNVHAMNPMALFAFVMIFAAIAFKIAAVPFQLWVPDVYQGAPTPVTAILSVGSKAAGILIMIRLFFGIFAGWHPNWSLMLACLSAITMCYGNLGALFQTNIKRMLGYSSIAHAGYLMMGLAAGSILGASAINLYLIGYLFTNLAAFTVIVLFSLNTPSDEIHDYAGLSRRNSLLAAALLLALVSLAGLPPLAGFFGKFTLLMAAVQSGYIWLALIAVVNIIISVYYYMMIVKKMYVDGPHVTTPIVVPVKMQVALAIAMAGIVIVGIYQAPFLNASYAAIQGMYLNLFQ